jgi:hypothetical protein
MLLSAALFALFMTGFWLYCLTDAILTPAPDCRGLTKPTWIAVISVTFIGGALAWLIVRRPARYSYRSLPPAPRWDLADLDDEGRAGVADAQAAPKGPDDDLEFLRAIHRAIQGNRQAGGDA